MTTSWPRWLAVTAGVLIPAIWVAVLARGPATPARALLEKTSLKVLDAEQRELWSVPVPAANLQYSRTLLRDVDGDGIEEVLLSLWPTHSESLAGWLRCFDHRGAVQWQFVYGREMEVKGRYFEPLYKGNHLSWVTVTGRPYLLAISRHAFWYPAQAVLLEPLSGEIAAEYWHPGYIYSVAFFDVGRDGTTELLLGGANNPNEGVGHPGLAILPIPFDEPSRQGQRNFFGDWNERERSYLLFPRPDHFDMTEGIAVYSLGVQGPDRIVVGVGRPPGEWLYYYLDSDLQVVDLREADHLLSGHDQRYVEGLLDHRYSVEERTRLRKLLSFPTAPDGNSVEVDRLFEE